MGISTIGLVVAAVAGYLLGSANSSLIVGKFYGVDVRHHGSGNAGMTNTLRTLGKKAAVLVSAGDILKGVLAYLVGQLLAGPYGILAAGTAAIIGHNWPVYFGFKGGKGALTSITVLFYMDWKIALITLGVFVALVAVSRYVSLGSIVGAVVFPVLAGAFGRNTVFILFSVFIGLLVIFRHRSNISRILNGTESRLGAKKQA